MAVDQQEPGIIDVHSSSNLTASDGTAYSSWWGRRQRSQLVVGKANTEASLVSIEEWQAA